MSRTCLRTLALVVYFLAFVLIVACDEAGSPDLAPVPDIDSRLAAALQERGVDRSFLDLPRFPAEIDRIPASPQNPINLAKVELGRRLFSLTGKNGSSCASCHDPSRSGFSGTRHSMGFGAIGLGPLRAVDNAMSEMHGLDAPGVRAPSPLCSAWLWGGTALVDGALGGPALAGNRGIDFSDAPFPKSLNDWEEDKLPGLEIQAMGGQVVHLNDTRFPPEGELADLAVAAFPELPEEEARQLNQDYRGKAIAAFERAWIPSRAPAVHWARGDDAALSHAQKLGLLVALREDCFRCHLAPATTGAFHRLGCPDLDGGFGSEGRLAVTGRAEDRRAFRAGSWYNLRDAVYAFHGADVVVWEFDDLIERHGEHVGSLTDLEVAALRTLVLDGFFDESARRFPLMRLATGRIGSTIWP